MFINRFINKISIGKNLINKKNENIFKQINLYTINQQQKREFFTKIEQNELGVRYTFGKIGKKTLGPGLRLMVPLVHDIELFDTRSSTQHLPKQTLVTLDGVVLSIDSIIQYKVVDPLKLVQHLKDHDESIENLVQIKLIEMVPKKTLAQLLYERDGFNKELVDSVNETFESWGTTLESFTLSDIIFTQDVSNAMSKKVEAEFIKDSRILLAQSELISSKILVEAASELEKSPFAMRLRELESIESISKDPSKSFIFVPTSIIDTFSRVINNKNITNSVNEDDNDSDNVKKNIEK
ncbi:hypothetical protein ACTFIR_002769 [Dictyostelium discoideum]